MKAIILAAGEGSRLRPLTQTTPKPCLKIFGKSILEHNIDSLAKFVDEFIIVVKYKKEKVIETLGNNYNGVKISYFEQGDIIGTAGAIKGLETQVSGDFLLLNGDSIFDYSDLEKIANFSSYGCLVQEVEDPSKYGIFKQDNSGLALEIIEKPENFVGNLANLGVYKFNDKIFDYIDKISISLRGELEITDAINIFVKNFPFHLIKIEKEFIDVGYPWDILTANSYFLDKLIKTSVEGEIEEGVTIKGKIILGKGSILKAGTYIEGNVYIGKNSIIGPNAYIRGNTVIGNNCKIGNACELKNSSLGDGSHIAHLSYIGDSIIGNNVNIAGGFIGANLRHDKANIKVMVKGKLVDSGLRKLGIIIGDNVKTGINTSSYPGRIINADTFTNPGEIIK
ncbi:MAG: sugar phosphate nucleotidyltransferase [Candidatus Gracilibacteria bacterium]|nr:sugar phosphate nucleotidyltransferase [Candidatus Gracilibacteria bacterium]